MPQGQASQQQPLVPEGGLDPQAVVSSAFCFRLSLQMWMSPMCVSSGAGVTRCAAACCEAKAWDLRGYLMSLLFFVAQAIREAGLSASTLPAAPNSQWLQN